MPRDTNGNTQPLPGTIVSNGDTILPSQHNPALVDLYAMMTQSLSRDGQGGMRAILDMSGFRVINVGVGESPGDAVSLSQFRNGTPIGSILDYAGVNAPDTWMLCFGQAISRVTYAELYAAFGGSSSPYGQGDGSTTFNLPDARGTVTAGKDDMGGTNAGRLSTYYGIAARTMGGKLGSASHALSVPEMPPHNHTANVSDPGHVHPWGNNAQGFGVTAGSFGAFAQGGPSPSALNTANGFTGISVSINNQGGGGAHPNAQPTMITNKIIKVSY